MTVSNWYYIESNFYLIVWIHAYIMHIFLNIYQHKIHSVIFPHLYNELYTSMIYFYMGMYLYIFYIWFIYTCMCTFVYMTIVRNFLNIYLLYSNYNSLLSSIHIFPNLVFLISCLWTWRVITILICLVLLRISIGVFLIVQLQNLYPAGTMRWPCVDPMLVHRLRPWPVGSTCGLRIVIAGYRYVTKIFTYTLLLYTDRRVVLAWAVFVNLSEGLPSNAFGFNNYSINVSFSSSSYQHIYVQIYFEW